jgi:hypothetical protein
MAISRLSRVRTELFQLARNPISCASSSMDRAGRLILRAKTTFLQGAAI